jgi:hypothetical protein
MHHHQDFLNGTKQIVVISLLNPYICKKIQFMKITLNIEEDRLDFFLELIRNFEFVEVDIPENAAFLKEHLLILEERLAAYESQPDNLVSWEDVKLGIEHRK